MMNNSHLVIARSKSDEAIQKSHAWHWIASLSLAMTETDACARNN